MNKVLVIFQREYLAQVRSRTFLTTLVLMPVLMGGSIFIQGLVGDSVDTRDRPIAVIDRTGVLAEKIRELGEERNRKETTDESGRPIAPRFLITAVPPEEDAQRQQLELSAKVRSKELFAFIEIGPSVIRSSPEENADYIRCYSNSPTDREFTRWLYGPLNQIVLSHRFVEANLAADVVKGAIRPLFIENLGLVSQDKTGRIMKAEEADPIKAFIVPYGFCMLMFMTIMISGPAMMQNVIEEKMQRIAEMLVGSISPFRLMLGKLLGVISVSLTLIGLYLLGGYVVADYYQQTDLIPMSQISWMLIYAALAMVMFGSLFSAIGAACSEVKDAQSLMMPAMLVIVLPLMLLVPVIRAPNGALATWVSFFPPATPMMMVTRMAVPPGIPAWQPFVGVAGVLLFSVFAVFVAGRIFRIGLLSQGKTPKLWELARWVMTG